MSVEKIQTLQMQKSVMEEKLIASENLVQLKEQLGRKDEVATFLRLQADRLHDDVKYAKAQHASKVESTVEVLASEVRADVQSLKQEQDKLKASLENSKFAEIQRKIEAGTLSQQAFSEKSFDRIAHQVERLDYHAFRQRKRKRSNPNSQRSNKPHGHKSNIASGDSSSSDSSSSNSSSSDSGSNENTSSSSSDSGSNESTSNSSGESSGGANHRRRSKRKDKKNKKN